MNLAIEVATLQVGMGETVVVMFEAFSETSMLFIFTSRFSDVTVPLLLLGLIVSVVMLLSLLVRLVVLRNVRYQVLGPMSALLGRPVRLKWITLLALVLAMCIPADRADALMLVIRISSTASFRNTLLKMPGRRCPLEHGRYHM